VLVGGGGADKFVFTAGDSSANSATGSILLAGGIASGPDQIRDWTSADSLHFNSAGPVNMGAGTNLDFSTATATDFASAITAANAHLGAGGLYVAVQVGTDVVVFADTNLDHSITTADDAVTLVGKTLADITFSNFTGT